MGRGLYTKAFIAYIITYFASVYLSLRKVDSLSGYIYLCHCTLVEKAFAPVTSYVRLMMAAAYLGHLKRYQTSLMMLISASRIIYGMARNGGSVISIRNDWRSRMLNKYYSMS
jgi:hypothetical protein